jgi:hypothetical protein
MSILCDQDFTGSKSRNKVSVGEPAEGSLQQNKNGFTNQKNKTHQFIARKVVKKRRKIAPRHPGAE